MNIEKNQTWNQHVVKRANKTLVLETIKKNSPISRASIASQTGLNKGTVSSLVSELLDDHLIYESGPGKSSGGRRPVMLLFNKVAGYSIGIDLGVNYILGILTDLDGNIVTEKLINFHDLTYEEIESKLFSFIDYLTHQAPRSPYGIIGIGVGVPGTVDKNGSILLAPNLGWEQIDLKKAIQTTYDIPVIIENEANAGAYGEKKFGVGSNKRNIIYVSVGIGIGVGLILNGSLYKGQNGYSGELGHMTIKADGEACSCGNKGCWELYASERALIHQAEEIGLSLPSRKEHALEKLLILAEQGDEKVILLFKEIGDCLGVGINNIINSFNPELVIIGNRLAQAKQWIETPLHERVARQALWFQQNDLEITFSDLSTHSTALGVAAFSIENFLKVSIKKAAS